MRSLRAFLFWFATAWVGWAGPSLPRKEARLASAPHLGICLLLLTSSAWAHEMGPAFLQLRQTTADTYEVLWKTTVPAGARRSGLELEWPAGCTNLTPPAAESFAGSITERWSFRRAGGLDGTTVRVVGLNTTQADVLVRLERLDGSAQIVELTPVSPAFQVTSTPGRLAVAWIFLRLGFEHILRGSDHLLFVLGLLLIVRNGRRLFRTITAFTLAHSLTLGLVTLGYAAVPVPPVEAAIALSILFLGPEIVRTWRGESSLTLRRPWVVAFAFGLLHGFGFASGLSTAGMSGAAIPQALLFFNVGVELGQLAFVGLMLALGRCLAGLEIRWPLWVVRAPGYAVGVCGAFWTIQRVAMFWLAK